MATLIIDEIDDLTTRVNSEAFETQRDWARAAEHATALTSLAIDLFRRIEAAATAVQPPDRKDWNEAAAREFIPTFQKWYDFAQTVKNLRRECKEHGHPAPRSVEFLDALNLSKIMVIAFDDLVDSMRRRERGEELKGRPLQEVMDELQHRDGGSGNH